MISIDDILETLECLKAFLDDKDREQSFEAATILLLQFMDLYGHDHSIMGAWFPLLEDVKNDIQQRQFEDAIPTVAELLVAFRQVEHMSPASGAEITSNAFDGEVAVNNSESATERLSAWVREQALTDPALAEKISRLIQKLRSELGSDQQVVEKVNEIFGLT
jgi:hypothetical protein